MLKDIKPYIAVTTNANQGGQFNSAFAQTPTENEMQQSGIRPKSRPGNEIS